MADTVAALQVVVSADTDALTSGLKSASKEVETFGDAFKHGLGIGTGFAAAEAGIKALGQAFGALKGSVIDFNQQLDQSRAVFARYFEGNTETAEAFLNTLKGFAATTPFEFKDLSTLAIRLQNANTNAMDIIPTIKAIGNAASASGSLSQASLDRITLALTQMQMKGKVTGEEMLQLVEAGVPAWQLLADATGKPIPVLQKMASQGEISADVLIKAFRGAYENAGLLEGASKSLEGAMSTIRDVGTQAFADIGRSVYELATEGANALAQFLSGEQFQAWIGVARMAVDTVVDGFRSLLVALRPVGELISTVFGQLTAGDFAGAFQTILTAVRGVFDQIVAGARAFAQSMFGAGADLVTEYASGIIQAAGSVLTAAVDVVTSTIAAFLIGRSPPPQGPLKDIAKGGAATIEAWGEGAKAAAENAAKPAAAALAGTLDQLKVASRDAAAELRAITTETQELDRTIKRLRGQIDGIKDGFAEQTRQVREAADATKTQYADAIQGVRDQVDAVKERYTAALDEVRGRIDALKAASDAQEQALSRQIDTIKQQYTAALDAVKRQIDTVKERYAEQESALQKVIDLARDRYTAALDRVRSTMDSIRAGADRQLAPLQKQLEHLQNMNKALRARQDAERAISSAKLQQLQLEALGDPALRAQLSGQLAALKQEQQRLDIAEQYAETQKQLATPELTAEERAGLALKLKQLDVQKQLAAMVDTTKLAEATRQSELEQAQSKQLTATRAIEDANQRILELPLEQKIAGIKDAAEAALEPLQAQLKAIETEQKTALEPLQARLKAVKAEEHDALAPLQARLKELQAAQGAELAPLEARLKQLQTDSREAARVFDAMLASIAQQQRDALAPLEAQLTAYGKQRDALDEQRQRMQQYKADIDAASQSIRDQVAAIKEAEKAAKEAAANVPAPKIDKTFIADQVTAAMQEAGKKAAETLAAAFQNAMNSLFATIVPQAIRDRFAAISQQIQTEGLPALVAAFGAGIAAAVPVFATKLAAWFDVYMDWVRDLEQRLLPAYDEMQQRWYAYLEEVAPKIGKILVDWTKAFIEWAATTGMDLLDEWAGIVGDLLAWIGRQAATIAGKLLDWATEFITWVGPVIPELLTELGGLIATTVEWMGQHTGELLDALGKWAVEFVNWVGPKIPPLLIELGKLLVELNTWVITTALPAIIAKLAEWGIALVEWVAPRIGPLLLELGKVLLAIGEWILLTALPAIVGKLVEWGGAFLNWIAKDVLPYLGEKLAAIGSAIAGWVADQVNPANGSGIVGQLVTLGSGMITGLKDGIMSQINTMTQWLKENVVDPIPNAIKSLLGIASPSSVFESIGRSMMDGLLAGLKSKLPDLSRVISDIGHAVSGGGAAIAAPAGYWADLVRQIGNAAGLNGEIFAKQLAVESDHYSPDVISGARRSPAGARGIAQFMPGTAAMVARQIGVSLEEFWASPEIQIRGAARHMRDLLAMFGGNMARALVGYNAGPGVAQQWSGDLGALNAESRRYLRDILGLAQGGIVSRPTLAMLGERGPEAVIPLDSRSGIGSLQTVRVEVAVGGRVAEEIYVTGRALAIRRGRVASGVGA